MRHHLYVEYNKAFEVIKKLLNWEDDEKSTLSILKDTLMKTYKKINQIIKGF